MRKLLSVCAVMALLVSVATAQDQPRRGGGGGRGGRGGMMQGGVMLLGIPKVQEELKLTDDQKKTTAELLEKTGAELRGLMPDREALNSLSDEEKQKKFAEMGKKREELTTKAMAEVSKTLDAKQMERLEQLTLQREGVNAIARPDVAAKLAITPEQKESIGKLMAEARQSFGPGGGGNFQNMSDEERRAAFEKRREAQEKLKTDVLAVLTAEQKTTLEKLQGEKFEFPMGGFSRGGGGGGGQGGGEKKRPASKKDN